MATANPIEPFPADIDREAFGHWLSGFSDGEAHFGLSEQSRHSGEHVARFQLGLRSDDSAILELIQRYFGCGRLYNYQPKAANSQRHIIIYRTLHHVSSTLPHFDRFPLRSKKAKDYLIWREAVLEIATIQARPRTTAGFHRGTLPKWTADEIARLRQMAEAIRNGRAFPDRQVLAQPPPIIPRTPQPGLFD